MEYLRETRLPVLDIQTLAQRMETGISLLDYTVLPVSKMRLETLFFLSFSLT
jgi:hypothetical protein